MSILFADDTNMFFTGNNLQTVAKEINEDLIKVQEWLYCNKLSLNVLKPIIWFLHQETNV